MILTRGDHVRSVDPYLKDDYCGQIINIWWVVSTPTHPGHCRISVLRNPYDPTSWFACNPEDLEKVE